MSVLFNGTNQSMITSSGNVLRNDSQITIMSWVKLVSLPSGTGAVYQVETNGGNNSRARFSVLASGAIEVGGRAPDSGSLFTISSTPTISTGSWNHIVGVINYAANTGKIYINGSQVSTTGSFGFSQPNTDNTSSARSSIAALDTGSINFINAFLQDLRCYNRELSANEVLTIYASNGIDKIVHGLDARYCDIGPVGQTSAGICDLSNLKINATAIGTPTWQDSPLSRKGN